MVMKVDERIRACVELKRKNDELNKQVVELQRQLMQRR